MKYKSAPIGTVINSVSKQTGYNFLYDASFLEKARPVTIAVDKAPLQQVLDLIFAEQTFSYQISDKSIIIKDKKTAGAAKESVKDEIIHGMVTDSTGTPLPGVIISFKSSPGTTQTDGSGHFYLRSLGASNTIVVRYMGYKTREMPITGKESMNIVLSQNTMALDNVVVTGFQTILKDRSTASVGQVNETKLNAFLNTDLVSALEGKVAGLSMYRGNPVLRGTSTFQSVTVGSIPLLVIDGLITEGALEDINPYDIETVTVLKDGAASSIYGARAANGVIVISTKRGKKGKTQVSFNADFFVTEKPDLDKMHYASTSQVLDYEMGYYQSELDRYSSVTDLFKYYGGMNSAPRNYSPLFGLYRDQAEGTITADEFNNTLSGWRNNDYLKQYTEQVWQEETRQRYNLSLSSASDKSNTFFSFNYDKGNGQVRNNTSDNMKMYMKSTFNVSDRFTATFGVNATYNRAVSTATGLDSYELQPRYATITDDNGNRVLSDYVTLSSAGIMNSNVAAALEANPNFKSVKFNVLDELDKNQTKTKSLNVRAFTNLDYKITKGLKYSLMMQYELGRKESYNYSQADSYAMRYLYNAMTSYDGTTYTHYVPDGGRLTQLNTKSEAFTIRNQLDYNTSVDIGKTRNDFIFLAGFEMRQTRIPVAVSDIRYGYNPVTLSSQLLNLRSLDTDGIISYMTGNRLYLGSPDSHTDVTNRYASAYANGSYTLNNRYNLTGSIRLDQANLFGANIKDQYRPLWSVGAGWNATNETFLAGHNWLNYLKLRLTYGINGNIDQSGTTNLVGALKSEKLYTDIPYLEISQLPNPLLRWEKTASTNFGADFSLFGNKLSGSLDLYRKYSSDLLVTSNLDPTVGTSTQTINNGSLINKGIELSLSSDWFHRGDWTLSSSMVIAFNKNKVDKVEQSSTVATSYVTSPSNYFYSNTIYNSLYAYKYSGITNGYPVFYDENGNPNVTFDESGNPLSMKQITSPSALVRVGNITPVFNGSFQQRVKYKNFDLGALFVFYGGNKLRKDLIDFSSYTQTNENIVNRWTAENPNSGFTRLIYDYPENWQSYATYLSTYYRYSDSNVASATYVRLRNISLSYSLPQSALRKLKMQQIKVTAQVNNPFLWAAAGDDIDPETYSLNSGTRNLSTPRSFLMGLAVTF
ncbi:SusC/RagA family TonB-linked outer membrane protein [Pedobacter sp. AW31-3R]|uniref:SusC/RagA family TonB-linked outer membrane protein n=1 Tax=Pedobacter sp. AW31-3R TaxID=3445781 RepID=UPI003F9F39E2